MSATEIRDRDWEGADLTGIEHEDVAFRGADLTDATGRGAVFSGCTFRDCRFSSSTHVDAAFTNCTFSRCTFFDTTFTGCKLVGSAFDGCTFELLRVDRGDWSFVRLPSAPLSTASFRDVRMHEADLRRATCDGTRFWGVDLSGALLAGASLAGADLRGSDLPELDPESGQLRGAIVDPGQAIAIAMALGLDVRPDEPPPRPS